MAVSHVVQSDELWTINRVVIVQIVEFSAVRAITQHDVRARRRWMGLYLIDHDVGLVVLGRRVDWEWLGPRTGEIVRVA